MELLAREKGMTAEICSFFIVRIGISGCIMPMITCDRYESGFAKEIVPEAQVRQPGVADTEK